MLFRQFSFLFVFFHLFTSRYLCFIRLYFYLLLFNPCISTTFLFLTLQLISFHYSVHICYFVWMFIPPYCLMSSNHVFFAFLLLFPFFFPPIVVSSVLRISYFDIFLIVWSCFSLIFICFSHTCIVVVPCSLNSVFHYLLLLLFYIASLLQPARRADNLAAIY
jgi:hypothetical protein